MMHMSDRKAKQSRLREAFPFHGDNRCSYRDGWAIVVPDPKTGGAAAWRDMVFPTMDGANATAARLVTGECDIQPAREVMHLTKWRKSKDKQRTIILRPATIEGTNA